MKPAPSPPTSAGGPCPDVVRAHLEQLRQSQPFRSSARSLRFLQYVVEETLAGRKENLKERTIGVSTFNRPADYDSEADPVVRQVAVEVRKRLLQYYAGPGSRDTVRIEIPQGSYGAAFRELEPQTAAKPAAWPRRRLAWLWLAAGVLAVCLLVLALFAFRKPAPLDAFWEPLMNGTPQIVLCIGKGAGFRAAVASTQTAAVLEERSLNVHASDALVLSRLTAFLAQHRKSLLTRSVDQLTFAELRENPAVLIGAFNNDWSLRFTKELRFQFRLSQSGRDEWVEDTHVGGRKWGLSQIPTSGNVAEDYAIVTRVLNPNTGRMLVVLGGLTYHATMAAGEFVTNPECMRSSGGMLPENWTRKNLQIVLSTRVTANHNGPPRVIAAHSW
jgi:hypothetical protein